MPLQVSSRILYRLGALACLPIAIYNYIVWFKNPDTLWETQYLASFVAAATLTILSFALVVLSVRQPDRMITLCEKKT